MPSGGPPKKVRPLSDYGGPSRAMPEQPVKKRMATKAAEGIAAAAVPEAAVAAKVADVAVTHKNREPNRTLKQEAGRSAKKAAVRSGGRTLGRFSSQHLLIGEFLVCFLVLALSPLAKDVKASDWMKKSSAVCLLFVILSVIGSAGPKSRQAASGLGALITLALLLDQRSIFSVVIKQFGSSAQTQAAVAAGNASAAAGGAPQVIRTPQGPQTITVVPGPNGSWVAGNSVDF